MAERTAILVGLCVKGMRHLRDRAEESRALSDELLPSLTRTGRSTHNLFRSELVELQICFDLLLARYLFGDRDQYTSQFARDGLEDSEPYVPSPVLYHPS